jgi:hypothetical protein
MKNFKQFLEENKTGQFTYKDMTTQNFDICPSALAAFKKNAKSGDVVEEDDFREAVMAVDKYLGIEKNLKSKGTASEEDYERMEDAVEKAIEEIEDAGLKGHDYHQVHLDAVKELTNQERD